MKKTIYLPEEIIDSHCHGRDLRQSNKTTVKKTLEEARLGGIGISVFMPNTDRPLINMKNLHSYLDLISQAKNELGIKEDQYVYFGLTDDNLDQCEQALKLPIVVGLKDYPKGKEGGTVTTGSIGVAFDETIRDGMLLTRKFDKVFAAHCDDPIIIAQEGNTIRAEVEYVKKIIRIAKEVPGVRVVICHVSCMESAQVIIEAQQKGLSIAIELAPHYLWFDSSKTNWILNQDPVFYHCFNNLRGPKHREFLVKLLAGTDITVIIGSDNACHTREEKLTKRYGGMPSNQEMVAVVVTLAQQLGLSDYQLSRLLSFNAADFLGIPVFGELKEYRLVEGADNVEYNHGKVMNPWNGSKLLFPISI